MSRSLIDLANPSRFLALVARLLPWLTAATLLAFAVGGIAAYLAPDDYQQGATVKIMFIHVPAAWLGIFAWLLMSVGRIGHAGRGVTHLPMSPPRPQRRSVRRSLSCASLTGSLVGAANVGNVLGLGRSAHFGAGPVYDVSGVIALWRTIDDPTRAARAAAVFTLVGSINIPIIKFSVDWWNTLHQGASVLRLGGSTIHVSILMPLIAMVAAFTLLFLTLHLAAMRNEILRRRLRTMMMMQADAAA